MTWEVSKPQLPRRHCKPPLSRPLWVLAFPAARQPLPAPLQPRCGCFHGLFSEGVKYGPGRGLPWGGATNSLILNPTLNTVLSGQG